MKKKTFITMAAIAMIVVLAVLLSSAVWPVINRVETGKTPQYAEIVPMYYSTDPTRVRKEALAVAKEMKKMSDLQETKTGFNSKMASLLPFMTAQVTVTITPVTEYVTSVDVVSETPELAGDLGQNARNIRNYLEALDKHLGSVKFKPNSPKQ